MQKNQARKILLVENIHPLAVTSLKEVGFEIVTLKHSPSPEELNSLVKDCVALGIRSKTELREDFFVKNSHLEAIGAFCIGTNQIDLSAAARRGIPVFNAPHSNTRSVAELVVSETIALFRQLFDRSAAAHKGGWMKAAQGSFEVRGKTLGIIGYGHIGSQVSILAESLGMKVIFYDVIKKLPLGNAVAKSKLQDVLKEADVITLHVPETHQTQNMIAEKELSQMKKGSFLINASRGTVVDLEALRSSLESKHLAGAAIDVFPIEPFSNEDMFSSCLQGLPNVILTPHIGGSTEEAQKAIGGEVAESFRKFFFTGSTRGAVDFPQVELPPRKFVFENAAASSNTVATFRLINAHKNEPGALGEINQVLADFGVNIVAQSLDTTQNVGYVLLDFEVSSEKAKNWTVEKKPQILSEIENLPKNLKTKLLKLN